MKFKTILIISFLFFSCKNQQNEINIISPIYIETDSCIIMNEFDSTGSLIISRQLDFDSIIYGSEQEFVQGKLRKWKWFEKGQKYPYMIIYLDNNERYSGFKGTPFIFQFYTKEGYVASKMVNIPFLNVIVGYKEYQDNVKKKHVPHIPGIANKYAWVTLDEHKYDSTYEYYLCYYIVDRDSVFEYGNSYMNDPDIILDSINMQLHHPDTIPPIIRRNFPN